MSRHQKAHRLDVLDEKPAVWNYLWVKKGRGKSRCVEKSNSWTFPLRLEIPQLRRDFALFPPPRRLLVYPILVLERREIAELRRTRLVCVCQQKLTSREISYSTTG